MGVTDDKYERVISGIGDWASFYRANPNRFVRDYFGIKLKRFQEIMLCEMFDSPSVFFLGCRGISKTWLTALYASTRCVLYPGTSCVVASATRKQAGELVGKIEKIFMPNYPMFALEVESITRNQYDTTVKFRNGSIITVCTANENARGARCNILIIDEARLVKKSIIDSVLRKFLTAPRHAGFMDLPEFVDYEMEPNQEVYLTSGWYQNHWCYNTFRDYAAGMLTGGPFFAAALPYQLSIKEKLLDRRQVEADMMSTDFNEVSWIMEMCAEFWSGADGALYAYDEIAPARKIKYAFYPPNIANLISDKRVKIPNQKLRNEIRVMGVDIALMQSGGKASSNNDATSVVINQMILNENSGRSTKNIVFTQNFEGLRAEEQALEIRRLFTWYDIDTLVIDARGIGLPIVDLLMADMYDQEYGVTYTALGCSNNDEIHKRCKVKNAPKKIWAMLASNDINSQCALTLREEFRQGNIKLLGEEDDFEEDFAGMTGFSKLKLEDKQRFKLPYVNTTLMVNELVNLETEVKGNFVKVREKSNARKDRYSALSYAIWVSNILEKEFIASRKQQTMQDMVLHFKAPEIRKRH